MDMNATGIWKAPEYNLDLIKSVGNMYMNPSIQNVRNIGNSVTDTKNFDPLSLHTMGTSYSNKSTTMDFVKSGLEGTAIASTAGII
jgi:hypothetical protein